MKHTKSASCNSCTFKSLHGKALYSPDRGIYSWNPGRDPKDCFTCKGKAFPKWSISAGRQTNLTKNN